jgi:uncharacterized membrane protein (UPF0127 family)
MKFKYFFPTILILTVLTIIAIQIYNLNKNTETSNTSIVAQSSIVASSQNLDNGYLPQFEKLELARTINERALGYMNRTEICAKCGMLFIFDQPDMQSFWMKNTLVELKIIFLDDNGKIVNIGKGKPNQESPSVKSVSKVRYVLEVPANTEFNFKENQVLDIVNIIKLGTDYSKNMI